MTADELRSLLAPHGIRPVRDRGQHFLLDDRVVDRMIDAAAVTNGSRVLEIGPGPGILTARLLDAGADVVAVEIDSKLRTLLASRFGAHPKFRLLAGDARDFSNAMLVDAFSSGIVGPYSLVANLPYSITSETLRKFLLEDPAPAAIVVMIQREVADRILAKPGDMSALAVMVQAMGDVTRVTNVPAGAFFPPPKVDSAVIHIMRRPDAALLQIFGNGTPERFFAISQAAFAGKRKQLRNSLRSIVNDENTLNKAFLRSSIAPTRRPEELSIDEWSKLAAALPPKI